MRRIAILLGVSTCPLVQAQYVEKHTYSTGIQLNALGWNFNYDFYSLPKEGDIWGGSRREVVRAPWRGDYWKTKWGEIARTYDFSMAKMPSQEVLSQYSEQQLKNLSPAEKYDIVRNDFNYTLTKMVLSKYKKAVQKYGDASQIPDWEGICHGWANAALHFPTEPKPVRYRGRFSKSIPFGSHDVKALLSWFQGEWGNTAPDKDRLGQIKSIGKTCPYKLTDPRFQESYDCRDIKPQVFHLALANMVGLQKKGFVADLFRNDEVWNFPIFKYKTTVLQKGVPKKLKEDYHPEAVKTVQLRTKVYYATEIYSSWSPHGDDYRKKVKSKLYTYTLALDARGHIVDGKWERFSEQPDTLWVHEKLNFTHPDKPGQDILSTELRKIYQQSIGQ